MINYDESIYLLILQYNVTKDTNLFNNIIYPELLSLIKMVINNNIKKNRRINPSLTEYTSIKNDVDEYNDVIQELLLHLLDKVLPSLYNNNGATIREYIYRSINNKLINILKKRTKKLMKETELMVDTFIELELPDKIEQKDSRIEIINKIDRLIDTEKVVNKTNTIFLLLLKDYLIDNQFDAREFNKYCTSKMNIKDSTYNMIACRLGIKTKMLNEKFILNKYNDKKM